MSEPKMISPMLDDFIMGGAMSEHHGISCYPAIENESGNRYIVKVISVPASSAKLDALLLTGAYPDKESAVAYTIGVPELMSAVNEVRAGTFTIMEPLLIATAIYFCLCFPTSKLIAYFERRMSRGNKR